MISRATGEERPRPFRILVAEDDVEMRDIVVEALRDDGHDVIALTDGAQLLVDIATRVKEGVRAEIVDLIVSDIRMPICSGLHILEAIRESRWTIPVILMTAFGDEATRRRAESHQAILLDKPFEVDDLRAAIAKLLPGSQSRGPVRQMAR
jgi:CheY-like chemotaxis protein